MRAAIFHAPGQPITIDQVADPMPAPGEALVRIRRCGLCGSDLAMTAPGRYTYAPGCFGHEYAGEVVEVGREVSGLRIGDRVACRPALGCGHCDVCRRGGFAALCPSLHALNGGFAEYIAVPPAAAVRLPHSLSLADGALVEPIACGLHALRLAGLRGGERVLVLGAGAMAVSIIYWARALGARRIVALSRSAHRRDALLALGADAVANFETDDPRPLLEALGGPPEIIAECVGKEGMLQTAISLAPPLATVISMGMCMQPEPLVAADCALRDIRLLFPLGYSAEEFAETARIFDAGGVRPELMVSDVIALEDLPSTMDRLRAGAKALKVHVDPSRMEAHA